MRIKTFYAKNMSEAFREIKTRLGPDAILLSTKEIPCRSGEWGRTSGFEVIAACDDGRSDDRYSSTLKLTHTAERTHVPDSESPETPDCIVTMDTYTP